MESKSLSIPRNNDSYQFLVLFSKNVIIVYDLSYGKSELAIQLKMLRRLLTGLLIFIKYAYIETFTF